MQTSSPPGLFRGLYGRGEARGTLCGRPVRAGITPTPCAGSRRSRRDMCGISSMRAGMGRYVFPHSRKGRYSSGKGGMPLRRACGTLRRLSLCCP